MLKMLRMLSLAALAAGVIGFGVARADLITNGQFTDYTINNGYPAIGYMRPPGSSFQSTGHLNDWTNVTGNAWNILFVATTSPQPYGAYNPYASGNWQYLSASETANAPAGNILLIDTDRDYGSPLSQSVNVIQGHQYEVSFYDGAIGSGLTSRQWEQMFVTLGSDTKGGTFFDYVASGTFSGYMHDTVTFTAATTGTETLTFYGNGTPGAPPYMLLADLSMKDVTPTATPEPSSWAMMILGTLCMAYFVRRHRMAAIAIS